MERRRQRTSVGEACTYTGPLHLKEINRARSWSADIPGLDSLFFFFLVQFLNDEHFPSGGVSVFIYYSGFPVHSMTRRQHMVRNRGHLAVALLGVLLVLLHCLSGCSSCLADVDLWATSTAENVHDSRLAIFFSTI